MNTTEITHEAIELGPVAIDENFAEIGMAKWIATYGGAEAPAPANDSDVDYSAWVGDWTDGTTTWRLTADRDSITAEEV